MPTLGGFVGPSPCGEIPSCYAILATTAIPVPQRPRSPQDQEDRSRSSPHHAGEPVMNPGPKNGNSPHHPTETRSEPSAILHLCSLRQLYAGMRSDNQISAPTATIQ